MKIVLAGAESNDALKVFRHNPPPSVLVSNLYLQKKSPSKIKEILETYKSLGCWVIIDSGAFTFLSKYGILRTDRTIEQFREKYNLHRVVLEDWQYDKEESQRRFDKEFGKYFDVWLSHLDLYYEYSDMIAELDLDALVGIERMGELRQKYEAYKDKICYTPHIGIEKELRLQTPEEHQYLKDLLSSGIKYLGLGNSSHSDVEQFFSRYKAIKENKIRVHGWAQTSAEAITTLPFFSIDSSVDGSSKVLVRYISTNPTVPYKIEQLTIEELYKRNSKKEFRTTDFETKVPYKDIEVLTVDETNTTVWGNLYGVTKHLVRKPTLKLKVQGGKEVICTSDHSIITMNSKGELSETKADKLKVGDYVISTKIKDAFKDNVGKKALYRKWGVYKLTDNALQMYGLWIGDGHINHDSVGFSCLGDEECIAPIKSFMNRKGVKIYRNKANKVDGLISSRKLVKQFIELGLTGKSHTKKIPDWVYSLDEHQIGQFLKGYFSADGTAPCEISTVSKDLRDDLVCLLEMMGIYTTVTNHSARKFFMKGKEYTAKESWRITVRDIQSLLRFRDKIGFLQQYKMDKLNAFISSKEARKSRREEKPSYIQVEVEGVTFLKIRSIEQVTSGIEEVEVYDLSVEKYERFFANGILVHNTTWLSAAKFGVTFEYKDGWAKMKSHDHTQKEAFRRTCQKECEENGINFEDFCNDEPFSVLQWSALQWIRMAKYYEKDVSRSYWLTQDEASSVIEQQREEQGLNSLVVRETTNVNIFKDTRLKINRLCNLCEIATQCPHYIPNNTCIFPTSGLSTDLTSKDLMKAVIDMQMGRVNQAVFSERMKGGSVNSNVTKEIQTLSRMIKEYDAMNQDGTGIHISAKGEESVGVLERLFGGKSEPKTKTEILQAEEAEIIDE